MCMRARSLQMMEEIEAKIFPLHRPEEYEEESLELGQLFHCPEQIGRLGQDGFSRMGW